MALGSISGIVCGWLLMLLNNFTGVFILEGTFWFNVAAFAVGGAVFGIVAGGFTALLEKRIRFDGELFKGIVVSTGLWIVLRLGGYILSLNDPERYHPDVGQTAQGFVFAVMVGVVLGSLWKMEKTGG